MITVSAYILSFLRFKIVLYFSFFSFHILFYISYILTLYRCSNYVLDRISANPPLASPASVMDKNRFGNALGNLAQATENAVPDESSGNRGISSPNHSHHPLPKCTLHRQKQGLQEVNHTPNLLELNAHLFTHFKLFQLPLPKTHILKLSQC